MKRIRAVLFCNVCGNLVMKGPWSDGEAMAAYHLGGLTAEVMPEVRKHLRVAGHALLIRFEDDEDEGATATTEETTSSSQASSSSPASKRSRRPALPRRGRR